MRHVPENRAWSDGVFCVTITTLNRRTLFVNPKAATQIVESLRYFRKHGEVDYAAYVVMPDHVHVVLRPNAPLTLSAWARRFKSYTTHVLGPGPIWQSGLWSEVVGERLFTQKVNYVHYNPVRAGLCETPEAYSWSSATEYLEGMFNIVTAPK